MQHILQYEWWGFLLPSDWQRFYTHLILQVRMAKNQWWGRSLSLDLHGCDTHLLKDPQAIVQFVHKLCTLIKMKRHGATQLQRFGHGNLRGWSMMQFIETSSIVAHFDEKGNRAFIDIFSCRTFNPRVAATFCQNYFKAKNASIYVEERQ